ncbi:FAD-dependent oxidoreductase [bacterium]|nr:FAD-dependent oxidoreductase [bacterium]
MKRSVAVFGAGIAGLTVADALVDRGFAVTVYEKDSSAGGMAKSKRTPKLNIPTEHSWRGYAPFYYNVFQVMKKIPINTEHFEQKLYTIEEVAKHSTLNSLWTYHKDKVYDITQFVPLHPGGSIIVNAGGKDLEATWRSYGIEWHLHDKSVLRILEKYRIGTLVEPHTNANLSVYDVGLKHDPIQFYLLPDNPRIHPRDYLFLWYTFLKCAIADKRKDVYYKTRFLDAIRGRVESDTYKYLVYFIAGPGYGFDVNTISLGHFANFVERSYEHRYAGWYVASAPTSEAWINPWVKHLEKKGVKFVYNTSLTRVNVHAESVQSCEVQEPLGESSLITSDYYCISINPNVAVDVFCKSPSLDQLHKQFSGLKTVNNQVGFVIAFRTKIDLPKNSAYVLMNSKLNITLYPQDVHWNQNVSLGEGVKSLWSGTCIQPGHLGELGSLDDVKNAILDEVLEEVINGVRLSERRQDILSVEIYDEWEVIEGKLVAKNKKWVNNIANEPFRPSAKTHLDNLTLAGAHCATSTVVWSMEGAVESGKLAANVILEKLGLPNTPVHTHRSGLLIHLLQCIDNVLFDLGLNNAINVFVVAIVIYALTRIRNTTTNIY